MGVESIIVHENVQAIIDKLKEDLKVDLDKIKSDVDLIKTDVKAIKEK